MDSSSLQRAQIERLRRKVASQLKYVGRLTRRMEQLGFPPDDRLYLAARRAQEGMLELHVAIHYCACDRGRAEALVNEGRSDRD